MGGRLIVSLGSSRVAWRGPGVNGSAGHRGRPGRCLAEALSDCEPPGEIVVGSVARATITRELLATCRALWGLTARELAAGAEAYGVHNGYRHPQSLGVDRWAAIVAAYHARSESALIADCGTAITVDYVGGDGHHAGGLIAPGRGLMRRALLEGTRVRLGDSPVTAPAGFGTETEEAVAAGILDAAAGMIAMALAAATARFGPPSRQMLTGGDAAAVVALLGSGWVHRPDLVLDGLELLAGIAS